MKTRKDETGTTWYEQDDGLEYAKRMSAELRAAHAGAVDDEAERRQLQLDQLRADLGL